MLLPVCRRWSVIPCVSPGQGRDEDAGRRSESVDRAASRMLLKRKADTLDAPHFDCLTRALATSPSRRRFSRALGGIVLAAPLGLVLGIPDSKARKRRKKKKKCKGRKKKCGKGCCGPAGRCSVGICYCIGNEPQANAKCVDVAEALIEIIAEETGIAPGIIGANPEDPLVEQVTIDEATRAAIDERLQKTFGVKEEVPYYTEGIAAGADVIREELANKA
jgi:hypothetical protein